MSLARGEEDGYLNSKVYIIPLTRTQVFAHLITTTTLIFYDEAMEGKLRFYLKCD
jgi:hypothetical protein